MNRKRILKLFNTRMHHIEILQKMKWLYILKEDEDESAKEIERLEKVLEIRKENMALLQGVTEIGIAKKKIRSLKKI